MSDLFERADAIHGEMMAAYEAAGKLLGAGDLEGHAVELRRALRLSDSYHAESAIVDAVVMSRWDALLERGA